MSLRRVRAVVHGLPLDIDDIALHERGKDALIEVAAELNRLVCGDPEVIVNEPAVHVDDGYRAGWLPVSEVGPVYGPPEARTVAWEADTILNPEATPQTGIVEPDGAVMIQVPWLQQDNGGDVRAVHNLDGPVRADAYREDGTPIGYLAAFEISDGELQVQVNPQTAFIRVSRV